MTAPATLPSALPTLADRLDIQELYARYNWALDFTVPEAWADCFTEDGEFDRPGFDPYVGREVLHAYAAAPRAYGRHWTANHVVEAQEDGGFRAKAYVTMLRADEAGDLQLVVHGTYDDRIVRCEDGRVRFASRRLTIEKASAGLR